jgi:hypothetical protein
MRNNLSEQRRRAREDPDDLNVALRLAFTLDRKCLEEEALEQWEHILDLNENMTLAWSRIARFHYKKNMCQQALEEFQSCFDKVLRGQEVEHESFVRRGWSLLRNRAAAFRAKASSISGRFSKDSKFEDGKEPVSSSLIPEEKIDIQSALEAWLKAEHFRAQRDFDQAYKHLTQTARALAISDWPSPVKSYTKSVTVLSPQCSWCSKVEDIVADDLQMPIFLSAGRMMLVIISGALHELKDQQRIAKLDMSPIPSILCVRGPYQAAITNGAFDDSLRTVGSLRMDKNPPYQARDRAGRILDQVTEPADICAWIKDYSLAWSACDIGLQLSKLLFDDCDSGRLPRNG